MKHAMECNRMTHGTVGVRHVILEFSEAYTTEALHYLVSYLKWIREKNVGLRLGRTPGTNGYPTFCFESQRGYAKIE